jgi:transposase
MSKRTHRQHSAEFKMKVLKTHLADQMPVSEVCEKYGIKPSVYYKWQQELFAQGGLIFQANKPNKIHEQYQKKIKSLENKLLEKNNVLAELTQEYISLKKGFGEE